MLVVVALLAALSVPAAHAAQGGCMASDPFLSPDAPFDGPEATRYLMADAAKSDNAVCLDGTPGAYYFLPGSGSGANKWYVHHQGGGWCESPSDCLDRSTGTLGSSKDYPATASLGGGYFSTDASVNPQMYNWNKVFMRYCDGGSFSGNNDTPQTVSGKDLHYRGHHILNAIMDDLLQHRGLNKASDVVVSGCSAGGLATYLHTDEWASVLPDSAKVRAMPDSGFFIDLEQPHASETTEPGNYHDGLVWVFTNHNSTAGLNQDCVAHNHDDPSRCIFAEHTSPYLRTPTFPLQSEYDHWQIEHVLANESTSNIVYLGQQITARVKENLLKNPIHGVFLDSCVHHCGAWGDIVIDGDNQAAAFQAWYDGGSKHAWIQGAAYPCTACCKGGQ